MTPHKGIVIILVLWQTSQLHGAPVKVSRSTEILETSTSYNNGRIHQPGTYTVRIFEEETTVNADLTSYQGPQTTIIPDLLIESSSQTAVNTDLFSEQTEQSTGTKDQPTQTNVIEAFSSTTADGQTITRTLVEPKTDGTLQITSDLDFSSTSDATNFSITATTTTVPIISRDTSIRRLVKRSTGVRATGEMPRNSSSNVTPDTTAKSEVSTAIGTSISGYMSRKEQSQTEVSTLPENTSPDRSTSSHLADDRRLLSSLTPYYLSIIVKSLSEAADLSKRNAMTSCTTTHNIPQSHCEQIFNASMVKESGNMTCINIKSSFTHALQTIKSAWATASYFFNKYSFMPFLRTAYRYLERIGSRSGLPIPSTTPLPTGIPVPDYNRDLRLLGELYSKIKLVESIMAQIQSCLIVS